jgi:CubicO group peptidase (beta-lactamase class C family)
VKLTAAVFLLAAIVPLLPGQQHSAPRFTDPGRRAALEAALPELEKVFENYRTQRGIPGLAYGVVIDGDLVAAKGLGVHDVASGDSVTPDTVFRIASMTKSFTALAILKLRDEGKLSLEDPVSKFIPELAKFAYPTSDSAPIRVRHLLTHGAGFPEDNPWGDRQLDAGDEKLTRWLEAGLPFSTAPDTAYEYANYGFALLGRIVAKASGTPYREYLEKQILAPLGMSASTLEPSAVPDALRARGYRKSGDGHAEVPPLAHGAFGAMGGLLTSSRDLGRYVAFQLAAFPPRDGAEDGPVRRSSRREMQSAWRPSDFVVSRSSPDAKIEAVSSSYGYGLAVSRTCDFDHIVAHSGGLPGFGSHMRWLPQYGVGIFAMANLTYQSTAPAVAEAFGVLRKTGALQPRELPPTEILRSTGKAITSLWQRWDDRAANDLAADNLFQDQPAEERRAEIERIQQQVGACSQSNEVRPENLLRGSFRLSCEQGFVDVTFTLAPTIPPKVQHLSFVSAKPLEAGMKAAAEGIAALIGYPSDEGLGALAAPSLDQAALRSQLEALRSSYGTCSLAETVAGDGATDVRLRFECARGPLEARLKADSEGKLIETSFVRPAGSPCVP